MASDEKILAGQLKQTCKLTKARWSAWLSRTEKTWEFRPLCSLSKIRLHALAEFIDQPKTATWLAGSLSSGRARSRGLGNFAEVLGCQRIYIFPNPRAQGVILVGADQLTNDGQSFFRILAMGSPLEQASPDVPFTTPDNRLNQPFELGPEVSYDPQKVFDWVLEILTGAINCEAAYVAVRAGDVFRIEAVWNYAKESQGAEISIPEDPVLARMVASHQGVILSDIRFENRFIIQSALTKSVKSCMCAPIAIGKRVIGLVVFVSFSDDRFSSSDLHLAVWYLERAAYAVENAIVFTDVARYLQQFALLTELAAAASAGTDTDEVARRVVRRLIKTFHTGLVAVLLDSGDGKTLREYGADPGRTPMVYPIATSLVGYVVETGQPVLLGDISQAPRFLDEQLNVHSALVVPLKFRGKVIGTIAVESTESNAFTAQDEQLLVVIATHLAGLLENVRLHQETRDRASNLSLIHQVLQQIVGLTDVNKIAQTTAELMAEYFKYEISMVLVVDEARQDLVTIGIGGTMAHLIPRGFRYNLSRGITGEVIRTGNSLYVNDVTCEPAYCSIPGWEAGSEMCVPLRERDRIFGLINLEREQKHSFSEGDLPMLESLAGILSSVMMNARRYQELQAMVGHLQAARETGLDISGDLDLNGLIKRVVHRALELVHAKGAALALVKEENNEIEVVFSENPWIELKGVKVPWMEGVIGRVASLGTPIKVADYNNWSHRLFPETRVSWTTVAGVPLKWKGQVLGVLVVQDDEPGRVFGDDEIQLLELLAPQVAVSVHNARLYRELEERIEVQHQTEKRLIRSARLAAVGEMAAGVAHELNNPLTSVAGFVELALDELPEDLPQREELAIVLSETHRARGVVRRLLDFSRQGENIRVQTDLNSLISEVLALIHHPAHMGDVKIKVDLADGLPQVKVDPNQIKQVLLNLMQNALQAMPEGGHMYLQTAMQPREGQDGVVISVRDTGLGIPPELQDRIFDPFFTTQPIGSGTGLGLSVSYGIVTDHGGTIDLESQVGDGSCFTVWLPLGEYEQLG